MRRKHAACDTRHAAGHEQEGMGKVRGAAHCARRLEIVVSSQRVVLAYQRRGRLPFAEPYFVILRRALALAPKGRAGLILSRRHPLFTNRLRRMLAVAIMSWP